LRIVHEARKMSPNEAPEITMAREKELGYYVQRLCLKQWNSRKLIEISTTGEATAKLLLLLYM